MEDNNLEIELNRFTDWDQMYDTPLYNGYYVNNKGKETFFSDLEGLYKKYFTDLSNKIDKFLFSNNINLLLKYIDSKIEFFNSTKIELEKRYNSAFIDGHLAQYKKDLEIHGAVPYIYELQNAAIFYKILTNIQKTFIEKAIAELTNIYSTYMPQPQELATIITNPTQKEEKPFADYLHHDNKNALMKKLHEFLDNAKGKNVAFVIKSLEELKFLAGYNSKNELYWNIFWIVT